MTVQEPPTPACSDGTEATDIAAQRKVFEQTGGHLLKPSLQRVWKDSPS